jgi:hypothetical protein
MADIFGYDGAIGWGQESVHGTGVARTQFAEVISLDIKNTIDRQESPSTRGRSERRRQDFLNTWAGSCEMEVIFAGLEKWFKHLLGAGATAVLGGSATAKTHTFTMVDGAYPVGLTLEANLGDAAATQTPVFDGGHVTSATFSATPNDPFKVTWNVAGKKQTFATATAVTYPDYSGDLLAKGHQITMEIDDVATELDSFELTFESGQDVAKRILGSQYADVPVRMERSKVTGTFTADWISTAQYLKFVNGTDTKIEFIVTGADMGNDNNDPFRIQFTIPKANFDGETPGLSSSGIIKQVCPFFGLSTGTGTSDSLYIEMDNETATI